MLRTSSGGCRYGVIDSVVTQRDGLRRSLRSLRDLGEPGELSPPLASAIHERRRILSLKLANVADDLYVLSVPYDARASTDRHEIDFRDEAAYCRMLFPEIAVSLEVGRDLSIRVNRPVLRQILRNLVGNALRRGCARLVVHVTDEGSSVTLRVSDPGPRDGHEMHIVELLVRAHGGSMGHDETSDAFLISLPCPTFVTSSRAELRQTS